MIKKTSNERWGRLPEGRWTERSRRAASLFQGRVINVHTSILIVDSQRIVREALRVILASRAEL